MAVTKTINIKVNDGELEGLEQNLNQVSSGFDKVDKSSKKAGSSLEDVGKNGGAIATLDRLTGGLASQVRDAAESTKLLNFSLKGTRTALIATGIGAFVVALGLVVAYWDDIVDFITGANKALEKQGDLLDRNIGSLNTELDILRKQQELTALRGGNTDKLIEKEKELLKALKSQTSALITNLELQLEKEKSAAKEVDFWTFLQTRGRASQSAITEEEQDRIDSLQERLDKAKISLLNLDIALEKGDAPSDISASAAGVSGVSGRRDKVTGVSEVSADNTAVELATAEMDVEAMVTKNLEEEAERRRKIRDAESEHKQKQNDVIFNSASNLVNALKMLGEENKAFAVAGIIVDQVASAASAIQSNVAANAKAVAAFPLTGGQPFVSINTISTIAGIAAGASAAAKAISEIGGGGSAKKVGGLPNGGTQSPSFNVVGTSGVNQLAESLQSQDQPIRAYLTSGDINTGAELERNRIETATLS